MQDTSQHRIDLKTREQIQPSNMKSFQVDAEVVEVGARQPFPRPQNSPCLLNALATTYLVLSSTIQSVGTLTSHCCLSRAFSASSLRSSSPWLFQLDSHYWRERSA